MTPELAPIGISTYARPDHLVRCLASLARCDLADRSRVYIFSDAPRPGDEAKVAKVRETARQAMDMGFDHVTVTCRETNDRVANNRGGIKQLLDRHGQLIWLEEDIECAPLFLSFMNEALHRYRDDRRVLSICGYRPPIELPANYPHDVFALPRFCAWGFATWSDRMSWPPKPVTQTEFSHAMLLPHRFLRLARGGLDVVEMSEAEARGDTDALDVKMMFEQFRHELWTIYPSRFLAANRGHDGSGIHCAETDRFEVILDTGAGPVPWSFPNGLPVDRRVLRSNRRWRSTPRRDRLQRLASSWSRAARSTLKGMLRGSQRRDAVDS